MKELFSTFQGRMMAMGMAIGTLVFFGIGGAALIVFVQERALAKVMSVHPSILIQIVAGLVGGTMLGLLAKFIVSRPSMDTISMRYALLIQSLQTTRMDRFMLSLCAGVGEEIFFRGAIQWWFGIPLTAILFVAIHGYLNPKDVKLFMYGAFMTLMFMGFGWVANRYGLWAPIAAHMMIDVVLLEYLNGIKNKHNIIDELNHE